MCRRVRRGLLFLIGIVGALAAVWRFAARERLLLEHATCVVDTSAWGRGGRRFNESIDNHWLSDKEILFDRYEGPQHNQRTCYKRDIETGQETQLPGLTQSRQELGEEVVDSQCVSPDGKWFTCSARWGDCLLAEVNGTRHYLYKSEKDDCSRALYWLPDNRHWLEHYGWLKKYGEDGKISCLLHDTQNPRVVRELQGNETLGNSEIKRILTLDKAISVEWPENDLDDFGRVLVKEDAPDQTKQVTVSIVPWRKSGKPFIRYTLSIPAGVKHYYFVLSPQTTRAAWLVDTQTPLPLQAWLHRFLPFVKSPLRKTTALWVSNLDGSNRHEIGHVPVTSGDKQEGDDPTLLDELKWLPGGKKLSFEYHDTLYTVPAD